VCDMIHTQPTARCATRLLALSASALTLLLLLGALRAPPSALLFFSAGGQCSGPAAGCPTARCRPPEVDGCEEAVELEPESCCPLLCNFKHPSGVSCFRTPAQTDGEATHREVEPLRETEEWTLFPTSCEALVGEEAAFVAPAGAVALRSLLAARAACEAPGSHCGAVECPTGQEELCSLFGVAKVDYPSADCYSRSRNPDNILAYSEHPAAGDKWMIGDAFLGGPVTVPPAEGEKGTPAAWHQYRWVDFVTGLKYGVATVETGLDVISFGWLGNTDNPWMSAFNRFNELDLDAKEDYKNLDAGGRVEGTMDVFAKGHLFDGEINFPWTKFLKWRPGWR